MRFISQRREVLGAAKTLASLGLNRGSSGNVSLRVEGGFVITSSGVPWAEAGIEDLVDMKLDGRVPHGQPTPSTEWQLHQAVYQSRPEIEAVVHTHSMFCTTLSTLRMDLPAVHYLIAVSGANLVRCAEYATFGTVELSNNALAALGTSKACLLANHGMIALGTALKDALRVAEEIELVAEQYWRGLQIGAPHVLSDAQMAEVHVKFRTYGKSAPRKG